MEAARGTPGFIDRYRAFMEFAATHVTVLAPFLSPLGGLAATWHQGREVRGAHLAEVPIAWIGLVALRNAAQVAAAAPRSWGARFFTVFPLVV